MGKPTIGCFKIITCAGEEASEGKGSTGRGWSFRKRSARHRTLSNTVISEAPPSANKGSPELIAADSQVQPNLTGSEKTSLVQCHEEKNEVSDQPDPKISDNIAPTLDASLDDSSIIILQAAIRRSLAQRYLLKKKSIVKLQAVVRGHIVRKQAVGTLRCVQAIVKMQVLIRARRGRRFLECSGDSEKQGERSGKFNLDPTPLSKGATKPHGTYSYISIEQLLKNKFARQLMESTPRTERINIKCDPLKSDSAWKWLERWMSVSSVHNKELQESESVPVQHGKENFEYPEGKKEIVVPSECYSESRKIKSSDGSLAAASEDVEDSITYDANNVALAPDACKSMAPASSHPQLQNVSESTLAYDTTESAPIEAKDIGSSGQDPGVESSFNKISSSTDQPFEARDIGLADSFTSNASAVHIGGSECATVLSVSSTLDSTDRTKIKENNPENKSKRSGVLEAGESITSVISIDSPKLALKSEATLRAMEKSPAVASSRSIMTVPKSQATPSSQVSVKPNKGIREKSKSNQKSRSSSGDKTLRIPSEQKQDKNGKRRNSFGSAKPKDHAVQEPRDGRILPSYMQPTESARAKAIVNRSPRASPDVHETDIFVKRRHSLPGTDGRHGSPRIQRSLSQTQQRAKGSETHSSLDRKWQR